MIWSSHSQAMQLDPSDPDYYDSMLLSDAGDEVVCGGVF